MTAYGAGELDQRVTFKRESMTSDGMGGHVRTFTEIATVPALVRPMSGREREHSQAIQASANYFIVIRYRDDVRENDTALWNGRSMNIRFVRDRGARSLFLEIEAEAGVAV